MDLDPALKAEAQKNLAKANEMQAWFLTKPPEVAAVIGLRTGLRLLPFILAGTPDGQFEKKERHRVVMAFRYLALARLCATSHSVAFNRACTALNSVAHRTGTSVTASIKEGCSAAFALLPPHSTPEIMHRSVAVRAAYSLRIAAAIFLASDWQLRWGQTEVDREWVDGGGSASELQRKRLWLDQSPFNNLPEPHLTAWKELRQVLENDDPSWRVWASWYEDRLAGKLPDPDEIELFRVTLIPDAHLKARDSSKEGERLWKEEMESKHKLLRNDPRKSNRVVERFIADWHTQGRSATLNAESPALVRADEGPGWRSGWLRKLLKATDE